MRAEPTTTPPPVTASGPGLESRLESSQRALVDRFRRRVTYLRLSVTDRCNYRCTYCMPATQLEFMPSSELLSFEEIIEVVSAMAEVGVRRVRVTGGEPLVRRDVTHLVAKLGEIPGIDEVVMTTNGHLLARHAADLAAAGLAAVNVSVDSLRPERFAAITRGGDLSRVLEGVQAAKDAGIPTVKVNTVAIDGFNDDEIVEFVRFGAANGIVQRFIEFMPIGSDTIWEGGRCLSAKRIREDLGNVFRMRAVGFQDGNGPARYWHLSGAGLPKEGYEVGIIAAVTECFCDACNRVRLTAQGGLRACLADDREVDLKRIVRTNGSKGALLAAVHGALVGKRESHDFDLDGGAVTTKQMVSIGG